MDELPCTQQGLLEPWWYHHGSSLSSVQLIHASPLEWCFFVSASRIHNPDCPPKFSFAQLACSIVYIKMSCMADFMDSQDLKRSEVSLHVSRLCHLLPCLSPFLSVYNFWYLSGGGFSGVYFLVTFDRELTTGWQALGVSATHQDWQGRPGLYLFCLVSLTDVGKSLDWYLMKDLHPLLDYNYSAQAGPKNVNQF